MSTYSKVKKICKQQGLTCKKNLVSRSKWSIKCPYSMTPTKITIHNTYNDASAANEISYMRSNSSQTSFHWAVDDKEAILGVRMDRNAWHAGDGGGNGNRRSIGIEICYSKSGGEKFEKAEENAAILTAAIMQVYGFDINDVVTHKSWSGKNCPHRTLSKGWTRFKRLVQKADGSYVPYVPKTAYTGKTPSLPERGYLQNGTKGKRVETLQTFLRWATGEKIKVDGIFGGDTEEAVKDFQRGQEITADGVFGKKSLEKAKALINKMKE